MEKEIVDILNNISVDDVLKYSHNIKQIDDIKLIDGGNSLYEYLKNGRIDDEDILTCINEYESVMDNGKNNNKNKTIYLYGTRMVYNSISDYSEFVKEVCIREDLLSVPYIKFIYLKAIYYHIKTLTWDKNSINPIGSNARIYVVIDIKEKKLDESKPHIVLWDIVSGHNLGLILRSAFAFGIKDVALVNTKKDVLNSLSCTVSRGACFEMNFAFYDDIEKYIEEFKKHKLYNMMLSDKSISISRAVENLHDDLYSIVLGCETMGLPDAFLYNGQPIIIPIYKKINSLNVAVAASIVLYEFTKRKI